MIKDLTMQQKHYRMTAMSNTINEGLRPDDLQDLVKPYFSIDVFKPKIGEEKDNVVVAFYAMQEAVAKDLGSFIEKGPFETLDVEVAPAPDDNNNWLVFCEFERRNDLYGHINNILENIATITSIKEWAFRAYRNPDIMQFSEDSFNDSVIVSKQQYFTAQQLEEREQVRKRMAFLRDY